MKFLKHSFFIFIFIFFQTNIVFSQSTEWVSAAFGFESDTTAEAIALDSNNNVISVGYYEGILDFPNGDRFIGFGTTREIVIQKLNNFGEILWVKDYNSLGTLEATTVTIDTEDNIYVAGRFNSTTSFDGISLSSPHFSYNYFILKLDVNGKTIWAKTVPGILAEKPIIASDSKNNIYILGEFSGTREFNGIELSVKNGKLYLVKLDSKGNYVFVKQMGATGSSSDGTLTIDKQDNVIVTGKTLVNAVFGNESYDSGGGYIVKINESGSFLWSRQLGNFIGQSIITDSQNNIIVSGSYSGVSHFDDEILSSPDFSSLFVAKLNSSGNKIWLKDIQLNSEPFYFRRAVLGINEADNLYLTFGFKGELNYEGVTYNATNSSFGTQDIIISSLGTTIDNGAVNWSKQYKGIDYTRDKVLAANNISLYLTSAIRTSTFDEVSLENANPARIIVAKIVDDTLSTDLNSIKNKRSFIIYNKVEDNYTLFFNKQTNDDIILYIYDVSGRIIKKIKKQESLNKFTFDISSTSGIYFLKVVSKNGCETFKFLKK